MSYQPETTSRAEIDAMPKPVLLVFGVDWCPHCQAAEAPLQQVMAARPDLHLIKVEDGKGRALGRTFGVKLWPTLVLMHAGQELGRVVRPVATQDIQALIAHLS